MGYTLEILIVILATTAQICTGAGFGLFSQPAVSSSSAPGQEQLQTTTGTNYYETSSFSGETIILPFSYLSNPTTQRNILFVLTGVVGFGLGYLYLLCCPIHSKRLLDQYDTKTKEVDGAESDKLKLREVPDVKEVKKEESKNGTVLRRRRELQMDSTAQKIICATEDLNC